MSDPLKHKVFCLATRQLGFDDCRFTDVDCTNELKTYRLWLRLGRQAKMDFLKKHLVFKENPSLLLKDVQSAIVVIKNYKNTHARHLTNRFKISRYAVGADYHSVIQLKLKAIEEFLTRHDPDIRTYSGTDSRPLAERTLAIKSGIGFLGKNSMVIRPGLGSYFLIGIILTNYTFESDRPLKMDCGSCERCLKACPTKAIQNDLTIRSQLCTSYRTIERKTPLSKKETRDTEGWLFGCDICQEVCPYNHGRVRLTDWKEFLPEAGVGFDFFNKDQKTINLSLIPKNSPLIRAKDRVILNWQIARQVLQ